MKPCVMRWAVIDLFRPTPSCARRGVGHHVEGLAQVAAGFAQGEDRVDDDPHVLERDTLGDAAQRGVHQNSSTIHEPYVRVRRLHQPLDGHLACLAAPILPRLGNATGLVGNLICPTDGHRGRQFELARRDRTDCGGRSHSRRPAMTHVRPWRSRSKTKVRRIVRSCPAAYVPVVPGCVSRHVALACAASRASISQPPSVNGAENALVIRRRWLSSTPGQTRRMPEAWAVFRAAT